MMFSKCHSFDYEVRMRWWCCWVSVMCLCMKWGWCDDGVEWVSCVCVWSEDDAMMLLIEFHVFVYEVRLIWWGCWVIVICLSMKWEGCDAVVEWVSCVCVWSEIHLMMLLSECHVFEYEVRMMWWCCWLSFMCLCMKWGWCDDVVEWMLCVCVWS